MPTAAPPPSIYDNMAAMPKVGGAPKPSPAAMNPKQAEIVAAYKTIDAALDKMAEMEPKLSESIPGVKQALKAAVTGAGLDIGGGDKPAPVADNKSPQEPMAAPPDNKSPQETPVPA